MPGSEAGRKIIAIEEHFMHSELARHFKPASANPPHIERRLYDFAGIRLEEMDAAGIGLQVLSHQSPGSQRLEDAVAMEACRASNDALAAVIREAPDRFAGFAMLPTMFADAAADELQRAVQELGLKGAMIHGPSRGRFVDGPDFSAIYARAAALDVPVYLHPAMPDKAVAETYYAPYSESHPDLLRAAWGFGVEAGTQAVRLILSGIFDKHPGLKIVLGHLGEAIPFLLPRIDDSLKRKGNAPVCFAEVFKSNFYVTTSGFFSTNALTCCLEELGPDRVLFAVDWPYADNVQGVTWLSGAPIAADVKQAIFYDNAINLLKL